MARKETFYQRPIDRTPYQACIWLALILVIAFILGFVLFWKAASYVKRHAKLPSVSGQTQTQTDQTLNDIQKSVQDQIDQKKQQAVNAATQAAKDAANAEIQKQKNQLLNR